MDDVTTSFEQQRSHLRAVAYRMLGSRAEAEDAVQDTWLRLQRADIGAVDNLGGWLTTVVARVCLNALRARRTRGEQPLEGATAGARRPGPPGDPEPIVGPASGGDPEQEALMADSVSLALLVVLETLTPSERVAFVLHDVFGVPFEEIAPMLVRSPAAARQLASRARRRVRDAAPEPDAALPAQREVVEAFFTAARSGDFDRLVAVLHPEVILRVDAAPAPVIGAECVAAQATHFADPAREVRAATINGAAGVVILLEGAPVALMAFVVVGGRVAAIDVVATPERLARLALAGI